MSDQTHQQLVDALRRRIADPGAYLPRIPDTAVNPGETVGNWAARAIAAGLEDGTLGYVPATELEQVRSERDERLTLAESSNLAKQIDRLTADLREAHAILATVNTLHQPRTNSIGNDLCKACNTLWPCRTSKTIEGPALVPGSSQRAQESERCGAPCTLPKGHPYECDPEPVNLEETAARRFAGEVWRLASGLADRGIPLVPDCPVDTAPVDTALAALDSLTSTVRMLEGAVKLAGESQASEPAVLGPMRGPVDGTPRETTAGEQPMRVLPYVHECLGGGPGCACGAV